MKTDNIRFMSLSSGSCGNCYYLGTDKGGILIDAGVSLRRLKKTLMENGLDMNSFSAILVTHDHLDHIRHLGSFCKKLSVPVYTTDVIHGALSRHTFTAPTIAPCRRILPQGKWSEVAGMKVRYFIVPHDATQTVGYAIEVAAHKFVIMTDVGRMTDEAVGFARQADTVVVESNYDMDMLMGGPYTHELKMRIVQGCGHLSNDECAAAVKRFWHKDLKNIFLCHLSDNNNTRQLAAECTAAALKELGVEQGTVSLRCLPREYPSQLFTL
ncbi:MAG: MBL fold metallo-hydrolase [Bacteroidales bacterium]|nr:MBL fold metallo-hydrolase [Bacteroidales bacterium]